MRNLKLPTKDINEYYEGMPHLEDWEIQKIFTGYNTKLNEVCMIAMFLGITSEELLITKKVKPEGEPSSNINLHQHEMNFG